METLGLAITQSLSEVLKTNVLPYKLWVTPYAVNIDFRTESNIPGVDLDGRCSTSIDRGRLRAGCTIFLFIDGERVKKTSTTHCLPTPHLLLHHHEAPPSWESRWETDGYGEWDGWNKPTPLDTGKIERQIEGFTG